MASGYSRQRRDLPVFNHGLDAALNTAEPVTVVNTTLPAPLLIPSENSNFAISEAVLAKGGVGASNLTPLALQELEVDDSPPYVWPTATTGHMSLSPIHQPSPADTAELIEYVHLLEEKRSIGVNPIPEIIPLPSSPTILQDAATQTDEDTILTRYEPDLLGSQTDAPLSSADKVVQLIDEGLIPHQQGQSQDASGSWFSKKTWPLPRQRRF